jgi:hypothetical protein
MGLKKYIKKYKDYETKELARRAAKRKKIKAYKSLAKSSRAKKINSIKSNNRLGFKKGITKAIGNPYNVKFAKAKKVIKKVKKKKKRKAYKIVYVK